MTGAVRERTLAGSLLLVASGWFCLLVRGRLFVGGTALLPFATPRLGQLFGVQELSL